MNKHVSINVKNKSTLHFPYLDTKEKKNIHDRKNTKQTSLLQFNTQVTSHKHRSDPWPIATYTNPMTSHHRT